MKVENKQILIEIYEETFRKVCNDPHFTLKLNDRNLASINNFLKLLDKDYKGSIGRNFIIEFIIFQFVRLIPRSTKFGRGVIRFNWVIGPKAIKYWKERRENYIYWNSQFKVKYGLELTQFESVRDPDEFKKAERIRFKDNEYQVLHCYENNLYSMRSKECLFCKFKADCIEIYNMEKINEAFIKQNEV